MGGLFPSLASPRDILEEEERKSAKTFKGDGTPFLKVPGCKSVSRVFIDNQELPQYIKQRFPLDDDAKQHTETDWPLWDLSAAADGTAVLLRSVQSNDGIWQDGITVTIVGEWGSK